MINIVIFMSQTGNYFFEFIRRLHKPSFDQAISPVLYHHFKKKVDNKIAPELKSF